MALSATYPEDLAKLLTTYMKDPSHVRLNQDCQVRLPLFLKYFYI
jgi:superfamily II DNA/RNA helicase